MSKQAFKRVRRAIGMEINREPLDAYAWPGGYPMFYLFSDGGVICPKCANANIDEIDSEMRGKADFPMSPHCGGWSIDGVDINWEEECLCCDHCSERIGSAYGGD